MALDDRDDIDADDDVELGEDELTDSDDIKDHIKAAIDKHSDDEEVEPEPKPRTKKDKTRADDKVSSTPPDGTGTTQSTVWDRLSPEDRALVTQRETLMTEGIRKIQQQYGGIHQVTQKLAPVFQKYGRTPDQGIQQMADWFEAIERNPAVALSELAKAYRIDITKLGASSLPANAGGQPGVNSNSPSIVPTNDPRIEQLTQAVRSMQAADQVRQRTATVEGLKAWGKTKPHFDKVRLAMAHVVHVASLTNDPGIWDQDGRLNLDAVYDKAIWMVPEVRDQILKEQQEAARAERKAKTEKSRRAGSSLKTGSPGTTFRKPNSGQSPSGSTLRDDIMSAIEELRS
jgi:hypothetical protein